MATTTRKRRPARKTAQATKATKPAKTTGTTRNRADAETVEARKAAVLSRVVNGGESAATVAKDLGITAGKAAFIAMQLRVDNGEVPKISFKNDEQLVSKTVAARDKADQHSSWGWLSARTGVAEASLKQKVAAAGHDVAGTKIASVRKASRPVATKTATGAKKAAATKSKSTRTRTRRAQADPS